MRSGSASSEFSRGLIDRSGYASEKFAEGYDRHRLSPPPAVLKILTLVAQAERPRLVVDLGAGTGLSTRVWAGYAEQIVGIEANARMLKWARRVTQEPNIRYVQAFASNTGLCAGSADLVTCAQAFHWMEPAAVLREAGRILRSGGVFAAYDYDVPPAIHPEIDPAFAVHFAARRRARERLGLQAGSATWPKEQHLERIRESGLFCSAREIVCHGFQEVDAVRVTGLAESLGGPRTIFGEAAPEVEETFVHLREAAERVLANRSWPMVVSYRIRLGVK
ncbi:MAG: class I SAM-dependent methyltransferase [Candidatus Dormibacter sp.]|uniref:class I SAM-dependent methyltransferase n=1 Tax=Candidatus Dormibacter sp. TaxID=2973982 RepID=UPI000DB45A21|nr:MAG: class I SAM-dependent methyltransferase [Candidatus Dormibacteraeota bacterium]